MTPSAANTATGTQPVSADSALSAAPWTPSRARADNYVTQLYYKGCLTVDEYNEAVRGIWYSTAGVA